MGTFTVATPRGRAELIVDGAGDRARGLLALGHGASGGVGAVDLVAVRDEALRGGFVVVRITQPYRVEGRRAPAPAAALDEAWVAAVNDARDRINPKLPLVVGGRSAGARVACRTAASLGAVAAVALAFPLHPPGKPDKSRDGELDQSVPILVVNGDRDPFGVPAPRGLVRVEVRPGDRHDLKRDPSGTAKLVVGWLRDLPAIASLKRTNPA